MAKKARARRGARSSTAVAEAPKDELGVHNIERRIGGETLKLSTGLMAKQADGAVLVSYGETIVLVTAQSATPNRELDFFPLTVEYREKVAAAGKFPGGFIKREGRPSQKEILTMRVIDRSIRPLFPDGYRQEVQIMVHVLSADDKNNPDVLALIGAAAALQISTIPFQGPIAGVRVGLGEEDFILLPNYEETESGDLDLVVSGSRDAIAMVEAGAQELPEDEILEGIEYGHEAIREICDMITELSDLCGKEKVVVEAPAELLTEKEKKQLETKYADTLYEAQKTEGKHSRSAALSAAKEEALAAFTAKWDSEDPETAGRMKAAKAALSSLANRQERRMILQDRRRVDGRAFDEIRPINARSGFLPRTHGSALFTRGETQALVNVTLGTGMDSQRVEGLREPYAKRFMLDYNFPPFCVGEVRPARGPGRREIGHGALAERALQPLIPADEDFPYTIRAISEILESNGSSSMATVCGTTLAMMDAGVPLRQPVAGIAMGLVGEGDDLCILSDILGSEDHNGDMDFKVAGTYDGVTALQMDIKISGLSRELMEQALEQARKGRLHILDVMTEALPEHRTHVAKHAPKLMRTKIPVDRIGNLIGPGGRTIKSIQERLSVNIEVNDDGTVMVSGTDQDGVQEAMSLVEAYTGEVEVGKVYDGKVVAIKDFGAFVEVMPGQEGLCPVSELSQEYVRNVEDVVSPGDRLKVKVIQVDATGRIKLSHKQLEAPSEDGGSTSRRSSRRGSDGERERSRPSRGRGDDSRPRERSDSRRDERGGRDSSRRDRDDRGSGRQRDTESDSDSRKPRRPRSDGGERSEETRERPRSRGREERDPPPIRADSARRRPRQWDDDESDTDEAPSRGRGRPSRGSGGRTPGDRDGEPEERPPRGRRPSRHAEDDSERERPARGPRGRSDDSRGGSRSRSRDNRGGKESTDESWEDSPPRRGRGRSSAPPQPEFDAYEDEIDRDSELTFDPDAAIEETEQKPRSSNRGGARRRRR